MQDADERGIGGVRLATARGLLAVTDQYGRFHITCAITPREGRGSNFVLKLDDRTLPSGFRTSTSSLQVKRATPGKALEFSFGASIHRVIGLDMSDRPHYHEAIRTRDFVVSDYVVGRATRTPAIIAVYPAQAINPEINAVVVASVVAGVAACGRPSGLRGTHRPAAC